MWPKVLSPPPQPVYTCTHVYTSQYIYNNLWASGCESVGRAWLDEALPRDRGGRSTTAERCAGSPRHAHRHTLRRRRPEAAATASQAASERQRLAPNTERMLLDDHDDYLARNPPWQLLISHTAIGSQLPGWIQITKTITPSAISGYLHNNFSEATMQNSDSLSSFLL